MVNYTINKSDNRREDKVGYHIVTRKNGLKRYKATYSYNNKRAHSLYPYTITGEEEAHRWYLYMRFVNEDPENNFKDLKIISL